MSLLEIYILVIRVNRVNSANLLSYPIYYTQILEREIVSIVNRVSIYKYMIYIVLTYFNFLLLLPEFTKNSSIDGINNKQKVIYER